MVQLEPLLTEMEQEGKLARGMWHLGQADEAVLKRLLENHARYAGSAQAKMVLDAWARYRSKFVKIFRTSTGARSAISPPRAARSRRKARTAKDTKDARCAKENSFVFLRAPCALRGEKLSIQGLN